MFGWMCRLFKKLKLRIDAQPLSPIDKLKKMHKKLKKKSQTYQRKASQEFRKEEEFRRAGDENAANLCLQRKSLYEQQIEKFGHCQFQIKELMIKYEGVEATTETMDALKIGAAAMQKMQKATNIDDGDKTVDEMNEGMENVNEIEDSSSIFSDAATHFDED